MSPMVPGGSWDRQFQNGVFPCRTRSPGNLANHLKLVACFFPLSPPQTGELHICIGLPCRIGSIFIWLPGNGASFGGIIRRRTEEREFCWTSLQVRSLLREQQTVRHWWMSGDSNPPAIWQTAGERGQTHPCYVYGVVLATLFKASRQFF